MDEVIIVGAGVGGLTLGLALHAAGIPCRVFESAAEIKPIGVGINLLPHATKELAALGLEAVVRLARPIANRANVLRMGFMIWSCFVGPFSSYLFRVVLKLAGLAADRRRCAVPSPSQSRAPVRASCST